LIFNNILKIKNKLFFKIFIKIYCDKNFYKKGVVKMLINTSTNLLNINNQLRLNKDQLLKNNYDYNSNNYEYEIDLSDIDNIIELSLLPYSDSYIMSKILNKLEKNGKANLEGEFFNQPIKLEFLLNKAEDKSNIKLYEVKVKGNIGKNTIDQDISIKKENLEAINFNLLILNFVKNINNEIYKVYSENINTTELKSVESLVSSSSGTTSTLTVDYDIRNENNSENITSKYTTVEVFWFFPLEVANTELKTNIKENNNNIIVNNEVIHKIESTEKEQKFKFSYTIS
jgi:hypothetical protein